MPILRNRGIQVLNKKSLLFCFLYISAAALFIVNADEKSNNPLYIQYFTAGKEFYSNAEYKRALDEFKNASDTSPSNLKSTIYLMMGQCHMALENYDEAEKLFDYLILNHRVSAEYAEAVYQKGRIFFIKSRYESSIETLNQFIEITSNHPLRGNAFYWIAESLYNLGHIDESLKIFQIVINKYKDSYKYEAAKYRVELINLSGRENELIKLLKWSHEEALRERELFIKKEKEYNQAILSYQKKLSLLSAEDTNSLLLSLRETNTVLRKQLELSELQIKKMNDELEILRNQDITTQNKAAESAGTIIK
jgi:tetratricopeptide (TPR) repeat protein